jgi:hypothetical protein
MPGICLCRVCQLNITRGAAGEAKIGCGDQATSSFIVVSSNLEALMSLGEVGQSLVQITLRGGQFAPRLTSHGYPGVAGVLGRSLIQLAAGCLGGGEVPLGYMHADGDGQQQCVASGTVPMALAHGQSQSQGLAGGGNVPTGQAVAGHGGVQAGEAMGSHESALSRYHSLFQRRQALGQLAARRL